VKWREEYRTEGPVPATYRIFDDGTVVAYGPERDTSRPGLWIASAWSTHPLDDPEARHIKHLCLDATRAELHEAFTNWEKGIREQ
jgi:hypothetical protein